jgi:IS5 family transposase
MGFRIQGQKDAFDAVIAAPPGNKTLEAIDNLINWNAVRLILAPAYDDSGRGWVGIDPVVLFKMSILQYIYNLSDVRVSIEAGDRLSFRRFLALSAGETAPDDTTLVKFRARLRKKGILDLAHAEFDRQLQEAGLFVKPGTIKVVDATVIRAATRPPKGPDSQEPPTTPRTTEAPTTKESTAAESDIFGQEAQVDSAQETKPEPRPGPASPSRLDPDAAFGGKTGKLQFGYKLHAGIDVETGMISHFDVTPANVADTDRFEQVLGEKVGGVLADKGYDSAKNRGILAKLGALDGIMRRVMRNTEPEEREILVHRNSRLSKLRSPLEGTFGALKRWRRLGRAVCTGIIRFREQVRFSVLAHNLLKAIKLREKCA